jgi:hypothetical protein
LAPLSLRHIERYEAIPTKFALLRLGCVWSPVQIRPPRPTENQMNFGMSSNRRSGAIRAMLRVFYKRSRINPKARAHNKSSWSVTAFVSLVVVRPIDSEMDKAISPGERR